jgi:protein SCO1/2
MRDTGRVKRLLACALLATALTGCSSSEPPAATPVGYHGVETKPPPKRPSFVLTTTSGQPYDFQAETAGHPTLIYFGYTNCPDLCPTAMADIATALRKVPADVKAQTKVLFVTTDPKRDTAPVLAEWLGRFSPDFIGLLGTQAQIDAAQKATGISPAYPDGVTPTLPGKPNQHATEAGTSPHEHTRPLGYAVAHSAVIFAYDAADRLPVVYPGGVTPSDIAADLPVLAQPRTQP